MSGISTLLPYSVLVSIAIMLAIVLFGTYRAMRRAKWPEAERTRTIGYVAAVLIGWLALALILSLSGIYQGAPNRLPTIQYGILIPIVIGCVLLWGSSTIRRIFDVVPQSWLIGVQVFRVLGAIFLILYAANEMPGLFAIPAGTGDVLVGIFAPLVAIAYARNPRANGGGVLIWNLAGMLDLVVAVTTGFLTSPSPLQLAAFDAPNELISTFPLILVPTFLVPFWIVLHIASLQKLYRATSQNARSEAVSAI